MTQRALPPLFEIAAVLSLGALSLVLAGPLSGDDPVRRQMVVWTANVGMLALIRVFLGRRGQGWRDLGLRGGRPGPRALLLGLAKALLVLLAAVAAFLVGAVVMANLGGVAPDPDMSGYDYLRGNLPLLLLTLFGVWIVSSFGEEVVYRGFLITRLEEIGGGGRAAGRAAVVVSGLVFGLAHWDWGTAGVVQTACMGLALGAAYRAVGRNLWLLVAAHAVLDTTLMLQLYFALGAAAAG